MDNIIKYSLLLFYYCDIFLSYYFSLDRHIIEICLPIKLNLKQTIFYKCRIRLNIQREA